MANMYRSVLAGGGGVQPTGDAVAADVLTGKTFSNASAVGISGTMPNNGAVSGQATPSQPYTIPAGYHNGEGVVTASAALNYSFTPTGAVAPETLGTNFTVGKHYIIAYFAGTQPTAWNGATRNETIPVSGTNVVIYDVTATSSTITVSGEGSYGGYNIICEY